MKKLVYNGESQDITVVTDCETVVISAMSAKEVEMADEAVFNAPDGSFYVEEAGAWYAETENCHTGADVEIYNAE